MMTMQTKQQNDLSGTSTPQRRVLIVEDDANIAELVALHLGDIGLHPEIVADGQAGFEQAQTGEFSLIILDVMLPGMDGMEICRKLRMAGISTPILMLTAKAEEADKVIGLELGADDYLTKPFSIRELLARVKAILRRVEMEQTPHEAEEHVLKFGPLSLDLEKRDVRLNGRAVQLTVREFDLLALFMQYPGRAFRREELLNRVWGYQFSGYDHTVNSHINRLRAKIEPDPAHPRYIQTVWGIGYRFNPPEDVQ